MPQTEKTPFYQRSPYAVAKMYAYWITVNFREAYGMFASNDLIATESRPSSSMQRPRLEASLPATPTPTYFLMNNTLIQNNQIRAAHNHDAPKFIFLSSSCIYPKMAPQPLEEEYLLTDSLELTNKWIPNAQELRY